MKYITHKPKLKVLKTWIALFVLMVLPFLIGSYIEPENPIYIVTIFSIAGFFIFNLVIRKSLFFKNYFTSRYNILTSKVHSKKTFNISKELMFEKIIEVINDSKFRLVETDKDKFVILAITSISLRSWGENLYINFETRGNETVMKFCSVTLFQIYSWGKNEENLTDLFNEIESSLTV
ncbi:hypothetical protein P700755_001192 [Psychroflexus torquis ATCC 700755]|uniref:Uncharacterized protein n=1 Tax=Psychroflexus torquis (strain ATCC 700755 / CIP 106069 / ACAM 623) TaxID=313595 RepID=K4IE65_PSYTT|nr:hypothetical protein [Psychroflexus torquis]AFU68138.1 hypothetical protein P700755_001192 [Psychroflexus torquis ATCC 700755]